MSYQAGDTYPWSVKVRDGDGNLVDPESLTVSVREPDTTITEYVYGIDALVVRDSEGIFHADIPLTDAGMWIIQGATTNEPEVARVQIAVGPALEAAVTFATLDELALRLGKTSVDDLTAAERAQGQMLLELVTGLIVDAVGKTDAWAATLDPIPRYLRGLCLEAAWRASRNPAGVSSESETLGAYSHTARYEFSGSDQGAGVTLTEAEERAARRAVYGVSSRSAYPTSVLSAP